MKIREQLITILLALAVSPTAFTQVLDNGAGDYRLTGGTGMPNSFTIGNAYFTTGSALNVRGDQMGASTGEVFRTIGPASTETSWRMFRTTSTQVGRLYAGTQNNNFHVDATNGNLVFRTNDVRRAFIMQGTTGATINGYTGLTQTGFLGVGLFTGTGGPSSPFTYLHIDDGGTTANNYRPWMKQGAMITFEKDQGYFGLKDEGSDHNHTVVSWSDNDTWSGSPDALKFIFVADNDAAYGTAGDFDGLEAGRFTPDDSGDEVYFGLGDWFNSGGDEPEERLDLLSRTIRIRKLVTDYEDNTLDKVVVTDNDGRLHWRPAEEIGDLGCEWVYDGVNGTLSTLDDASPSSGCPADVDRMNIGGAGTGAYKVAVIENTPNSNRDIGIFVQTLGDDDLDNIGVWANCGSTGVDDSKWNTGISGGSVDGTIWNTGVYGTTSTTTGLSSTLNRAVWANATTAGGTITHNYGVFSEATGGSTTNLSGYFIGDGEYTVSWTMSSDAMFKENVEDITGALDVINAIQPRRYTYKVADFPSMAFPQGEHAGVIAQELETTLPSLVRDRYRPETKDDEGNVVHDAFSYKSVNYTELIPYLIAAVKEQQVQIQQLQSDLAGCCSGMGGGGEQQMSPMGGTDANSMAITSGSDALKIQPNPFTDATTISYTLAEGGQVRLIVSTSSGKQLQVLEDVQRSAGNYTFEWNTTSLASGIYNVMLLLDGAPMVQKAVKIAR